MKAISVFMVCVLLIFALVSCGGNGGDGGSVSTLTPRQEMLKATANAMSQASAASATLTAYGRLQLLQQGKDQ